MAYRRTTQTGKDRYGDITALCGLWGRVRKAEAIRDIELKRHNYYVQDRFGRQAGVHVVSGPTGKYLRTDPNAASSDNLDSLPNC